MKNNFDVNKIIFPTVDNNIVVNELSSSLVENVVTSYVNDDNENFDLLIHNYELQVNSYVKLLEQLLTYETNKSVIVYNFGLLLELFLKMILLKLNISTVYETCAFRHKIINMFNKLLEEKNCLDLKLKNDIEYIRTRISLIESSKGKSFDYNNYPDLRYNHKLDSLDLIVIDKINKNDIKHIKEVLQCIESIMKC